MANIDPFRRLRHGDKLRGLPVPVWNRVLDGFGKNLKTDGIPSPLGGPVEILVRNTTADALPPRSVVGIDTPTFTYANEPYQFYDRDVMDGEAPTATATIAITQEPISVNAIGVARVLGMARVQVYISNENHTHAIPTTLTTQLTSATTGPATILHKDSTGTGVKWCVVMLGGQGKRDETAAVTITSSSPTLSRYPAVRRIQTGLPDEWPTAEVVWVYNMHPSGTLAAGMHLIARYNTDQFLGADQLAVRECCTIEPCECDIPALMCLTFGEEAGCLAGTVVIVRNGVSDPFDACGGRHRFTLTCSGTTWGGLFATSTAYRVITIGCCPGDEISTQMTAQFSNPVGDCVGCFSLDPFEMNYIGGDETGNCTGLGAEAAWSVQVASACDTLNPLGLLNLTCGASGGSCSWSPGLACSTNGATLLSESCNPFSRSYRLTIAPLAGLNSCCGDYPATGTIDVTFTGGAVADAGGSPPCSMSVSTVNVTCGPPFSATLNGLMTGADCPNEGMFWTATLTTIATDGDCGVSGGGSSCVEVGCEPFFVPPTITLTFAFTG